MSDQEEQETTYYDDHTLYVYNMESKERDYIRDFLNRCADKSETKRDNFEINVIRDRNGEIITCCYIYIYDSDFYRKILNVDRNYVLLNTKEHVLGSDLFVYCETKEIFVNKEDDLCFKAYHKKCTLSETFDTFFSYVKVNNDIKEDFKKCVKNRMKAFSTSKNNRYPKVYFKGNYIYVSYDPEGYDAIFSLVINMKSTMNFKGVNYNFLFKSYNN